MKYERNKKNGDAAAGSPADFQQCLDFFAQKVTSEDLGDVQAREVDQFINKYANSAEIT